jgi:hypothetical protein
MPLKVSTLSKTMWLWAEMVYLLESDAEFSELVSVVSNALADALKIEGDRREKMINTMVDHMPLMFSTLSMNDALASKKLEVAIQSCLSSDLPEDSFEARVMAALLSLGIGSKSWTGNFVALANSHGRTSVVSDVMFRLARNRYMRDQLTKSELDDIEEFTRILLFKAYGSRGPAEKEKANNYIEGMRRDRALIGAKTRRATEALSS